MKNYDWLNFRNQKDDVLIKYCLFNGQWQLFHAYSRQDKITICISPRFLSVAIDYITIHYITSQKKVLL